MKKYLKYLIIATVAVILFGLGTLVNADDVSWKEIVVTDAKQQISNTTNTEASALIGNIDTTIADQLSGELSGTVESKQSFLKNFIANYFAGKIDGLKDSPEYAQIEMEIELMTGAELERVKKQIDAAIANALK